MTSRAMLVLAACATGGCALSVRGDLPDVEITEHGVVIPGAPAEAGAPQPTATVTIPIDLKDQLTIDRSAYRAVSIREIVFTASQASTDLSFVQHLDVTMTGNDAGVPVAPPVEVVEYDQTTASPPQAGPVLDLPVSPPADVSSVWHAPSSAFQLDVRGALPGSNWTVDVTVHVSATVDL